MYIVCIRVVTKLSFYCYFEEKKLPSRNYLTNMVSRQRAYLYRFLSAPNLSSRKMSLLFNVCGSLECVGSEECVGLWSVVGVWIVWGVFGDWGV